jgi:hypothetical protein
MIFKKNLQLFFTKGKIGNYVFELLPKGQVRPWTFENTNLISELLWSTSVKSLIRFCRGRQTKVRRLN